MENKYTYDELLKKVKEQEKEIEVLKANQNGDRKNLFQTLFTDSYSIMLIIDFETGQIINANKSACKFYGYSFDELTSMNINQINTLPPEEVKKEMQKAKSDERNFFNFKHSLKNGQIKDVEVRSGKILIDNKTYLYSIINDATEKFRKDAELISAKEKAEESEEKFRTLFNRVADAIFIYDPETFEIIEANEATSKLYGYDKDELIEMSCLKFSAEVDKSKLASKKALQKGKEIVNLRHHKKKDGTDLYLQLHVYKIVVNNQTITFSVCHDITEALKSEQTLKVAKEKAEENEAILKASMENSQAGIAIAEVPSGKLRYVNKAGLLIRQKEENEIVKEIDVTNYASSWQIFHFDGTPYLPDEVPLARAVLYGEKCSKEFIVRRDNKEDRYVLANAAPVINKDNVQTAAIAVFLDITKRKNTELLLLENEKKLKGRVKELNCLYEISKTIKAELSLDDILERVVNIITKSWQFPEVLNARIVVDGGNTYKTKGFEETKNKLVEDIFVNNAKQGFVEVNYSLREKGKNHAVFLTEEKKLLHTIAERIGRIIERYKLEDTLRNLLDSQDIIIKMRTDELRKTNEALNKEISERIRKEKILLKQEKELTELNATKDKFFSIIAHDLKNPFSAMLGFSEILNEKFDKYDTKKQKKFLRLINQDLQSSYKLLENLLLWSRSQRGTINFKPEKIKLYLISKETIELLRQSAENKSIKLINKIDKNISVDADKDMFSTIIRNLISNAIKFTPKNGKITVSSNLITNDKVQPFVKISVTDTGIGIPPEIQSKLFDIGENSSKQGTEKETGTGLGLILSKEFIEKHGGKIWVESDPDGKSGGKGSVFKFTIPLYYNSKKDS